MAWMMPHEGAPHERTWMAFPREGLTLGEGDAWREAGYRAWADVALAVAEFEPVTMVVDPSESRRARVMLGDAVTLVEAPVDEFWMRDCGPTFVIDADRPGVLGAVDWIFNGWGDRDWADWHRSAGIARFVADAVGAELVSSTLVNEGGGIHVDGAGTVLLTETVQLDPRRNRYADKARVEAEMARTIGATHAVWLPRGLTRDADDFGTNGHVDIVACFAEDGRVLLHTQRDAGHPDFAVTAQMREVLGQATDARGRPLRMVDVPAPDALRDDEGFVDWSYINHLVVNGGVIACGFGEARADARARDILGDAYPGRRVVTVDARPIFARGGGIHCITQQQPAVAAAGGGPSSRFARSGAGTTPISGAPVPERGAPGVLSDPVPERGAPGAETKGTASVVSTPVPERGAPGAESSHSVPERGAPGAETKGTPPAHGAAS